MMAADTVTIWTYEWVPDMPRGFVREHGDRPASEAYIERMTTRPASHKAHADQMAHFEKADEASKEKSDD